MTSPVPPHAFTIVFTCSRSPTSRLIKAVTGDHVTHAALGFDFWGRPSILEATRGGVQPHLRSKTLEARDIVAEFIPPEGLDLGTAWECLDMGYDYSNFIGWAWVYLAKFFGKAVRNPFGVRGRMICSELILRMDKNNVVPTWIDLDRETTTPYRLYQACMEAGFIRLPNAAEAGS